MLLPVTGNTGGKRKKTVVRRVNARPVWTSVWVNVCVDGRTKLQMGPRIGPRVNVGSGNEGGRRIFRPRTTTSKTVHQRETIKQGTETYLGSSMRYSRKRPNWTK